MMRAETHGVCVLLLSVCLAGCASVRQEDMDAWIGQPVVALETHPVFATMRLVRTRASDGSEVRNYINGTVVSSCSGGGNISAGIVDFASYNSFMSCMHQHPACNNIFHLKEGKIISYTPIGTGGARCFTDARAKPNFRGAANL